MAARRLREQNKQRNLEHIKQVAKHLFEQKGYEATTTREIAEAASIGTGTLFLYVKDKAELLILIYADSIKAIAADRFATLSEGMTLLDSLMYIYSEYFRFYEQHLENSRHFLKELLFHTGEHIDHQPFHTLNEDFIERLALLLQNVQERGEISQNVNLHLAARSFHAMYFAAVTGWLRSFLPSSKDALDQLQAVFDLQIKGMLPIR